MSDKSTVTVENPNIVIDRIWPVSTKICPDGGIGIDWSADIGWGQYVLYWGEDGKLHADTECMDRGESKLWTKAMLMKLVDEIIVDD